MNFNTVKAFIHVLTNFQIKLRDSNSTNTDKKLVTSMHYNETEGSFTRDKQHQT